MHKTIDRTLRRRQEYIREAKQNHTLTEFDEKQLLEEAYTIETILRTEEEDWETVEEIYEDMMNEQNKIMNKCKHNNNPAEAPI